MYVPEDCGLSTVTKKVIIMYMFPKFDRVGIPLLSPEYNFQKGLFSRGLIMVRSFSPSEGVQHTRVDWLH